MLAVQFGQVDLSFGNLQNLAIISQVPYRWRKRRHSTESLTFEGEVKGYTRARGNLGFGCPAPTARAITAATSGNAVSHPRGARRAGRRLATKSDRRPPLLRIERDPITAVLEGLRLGVHPLSTMTQGTGRSNGRRWELIESSLGPLPEFPALTG